jgi:hypothetical protein
LTFTLEAAAARDDDGESSDSESGDEKPGKTEGADVRVDGEGVKELDPSEIERAKKAEEANSPVEKPNKTYYFVGARYRGMIIPTFMVTPFATVKELSSLYASGFGPELTVRKENFEYVLSAWFANYSMKNARFKAKNDPPESYEYVKANINALYLTSDFNWTSQINPYFGLNLGIGAGLGLTWGKITRTEAYRDAGGAWHKCGGPGQPDPSYCGLDTKDEQYGYNEPSWANGGAKPFVFPWLALQTGVRIKPHRHVMFRIDLGWAITGPFFGISGNYGI